jgi:hypothetical protein
MPTIKPKEGRGEGINYDSDCGKDNISSNNNASELFKFLATTNKVNYRPELADYIKG